MKTKTIAFLFLILICSCQKGSVLILDTNLSSCPINSTCTYNFNDNSNFSGSNQIISGNDRVFFYQSVNNKLCDLTTQLFLKIPMGNTEFKIDSAQIVSQQLVGYFTNCACCELLANVNPIGGEIKGKSIDGTHWLINAKVIVGISPNKPIDTLIVNQYFSKK